MTQQDRPPEEHEERVNKAFDSLTERLDQRLDDEARSSVEQLRKAASARDAETVRKHLTDVRERHSWLYRELAAHPDVATLLDELALWGF